MSFNLGGINGSVTISTTLAPVPSSSLGGFNLGGINGSMTVLSTSASAPSSAVSSGSSLASFNLGGINASESTSASSSQSGSTSASLTSPAPSGTEPPFNGVPRMCGKSSRITAAFAAALIFLLVIS